MQSKLIYQQARNELSLGSGNVVGASMETKEKSSFIQRACREISYEFIIPALREKTYREIEAQMITQMVSAIFAKAYQCGFCPEHASLVFIKSLELEVSETKEQVQFIGSKPLKAVSGLVGGRQVTESYTGHHITIFNRSHEAKLDDISTWNGITAIDTWGDGQILEYKKEEHPKGIDLVYGFFEPEEVISNIRIERNLTAEEWNRYGELLMDIKKYIHNNFEDWFKAANRTHNNWEIELANVNDVFDCKINAYKSIGDPQFMEVHSQDPQMFRQAWIARAGEHISRISSLAPLYDRERIKTEYNQELEGIPNDVLPSHVKKLQDKPLQMSDLKRHLDEQKEIAVSFHSKLKNKEYYKELIDEIGKQVTTYQFSEQSLEEFKRFNMSLFFLQKKLLLKKIDILAQEMRLYTSNQEIDDFLEICKPIRKLESSDTELQEAEFAIRFMEKRKPKAENAFKQSNVALPAPTQANFLNNSSTMYGKSPKNILGSDNPKKRSRHNQLMH